MTAETTRSRLPLPDPYVHEEPRKITKEEHEFKAYRALRDGRAQARHEGKRRVRAQKVRAPPQPRLPTPTQNTDPCYLYRRRMRKLPRPSKRAAFGCFLWGDPRPTCYARHPTLASSMHRICIHATKTLGPVPGLCRAKLWQIHTNYQLRLSKGPSSSPSASG